MELEKFKKKYSVLEKKYSLPSFKSLCEDFDTERAAERDSDYVLREIRKVIVDKIFTYLRFVELLLNPANAPMFFLGMIKGLNGSDKKTIERIYFKLGETEIDVIELDNSYSEKAEAEFLIKISKEWQDIKEDIKDIISAIKSNWNNRGEKREKSYLG